jgi:predicted DNA-binding protein (MmcQ/YjbR family)
MRKSDAYNKVGRICMAFPEVEMKPFGGHHTPCWRVRDKIFCGTGQEGRARINVKGAPGAQQALVASAPDRFFVPPYSGPKGWIGIWLDGDVDWDEVAELVEDSYRLVAPKTLAKSLG